MNAPVITITQLTRRFTEMVAVDNLSLEVFTGEIFGFLGHDGAGKTATVRLLNGVIESTSTRRALRSFANPCMRGSERPFPARKLLGLACR